MSKPLTEGKMKGGNGAVKELSDDNLKPIAPPPSPSPLPSPTPAPGADNSWLSDRTKTIMVSVVMILLIGGMALGYYSAYQWRQERAAQIEIQIELK